MSSVSLASYDNCYMDDKPKHILFLGQTETGKSTAWRWLLIWWTIRFNIGGVWVFSKNIDKETWVLPDRGLNRVSKTRLQAIRNAGEQSPDCYQIVVFDDIMGEDFHHDKFFTDLTASYRHQNVFFIFSIQSLHNAIPPAIRDNFMKIVIVQANNETITHLFKLSRMNSLKEFKAMFKEGTLTKGKPIMLNTIAGEPEIIPLTFGILEPCDMISIGF